MATLQVKGDLQNFDYGGSSRNHVSITALIFTVCLFVCFFLFLISISCYLLAQDIEFYELLNAARLKIADCLQPQLSCHHYCALVYFR